jgi:hypothetical protein
VSFPFTLTTDDQGNGGVSTDFRTPPGTTSFPDGTSFDVEFRVVDNVAAPTSDIRSDCFDVDVL